MNHIDTQQLLEQLRATAAQARPLSHSAQPTEGASFSTLLAESIEKVNGLQQRAGDLKKAFEVGDPRVDLPDVMIASSKAGIAFQAALHIRNKLVEAYQEISRMAI